MKPKTLAVVILLSSTILSISIAQQVAPLSALAKMPIQEINRIHNAATWENQSYARVELSGVIKLANRKNEAVDLEGTRNVLGNVDSAENNGRIEKLNVLEDDSFQAIRPNWWGWYSCPNWWSHFNGVTKITWKLRLEPTGQIELKYKWNYYSH